MITKVKICGITNTEDARVAVDAGADLLGFILYPKSPRYVEPAKIAEIVTKIKDRRPKTGANADLQSSIFTPPLFVGVFVNEPLDTVQSILDAAGLDLAQLHGDEGPEMLAQLPGRAYKALRPATAEQALAEAKQFAVESDGQRPGLMIDAYDPKEYGGTGKRTDWHVAATLADQYPGLLLAGGLTPDNVAEAVRIVGPWGADVSSGVEAEPGVKDHDKVRAFVRAVRCIDV